MKTFCILALFFLHAVPLKAQTVSDEPKETVILQLPNNDRQWRQAHRYVTSKKGIVELISKGQSIKNWVQLIIIQYVSNPSIDASDCNFEKALERLQKGEFSAYNKQTVSWKIIEQHDNDLIYDWVTYNMENDQMFVEHEISRAFFTSSGAFHRVGFRAKGHFIEGEYKDTVVEILKNHTAIVSFEEAKSMEGFSLVNTATVASFDEILQQLKALGDQTSSLQDG